MLQPRFQESCTSTHCKVERNSNNETFVSVAGMRFDAVSPGPSGKSGTVGFEVVGSPGYYLREYHQHSYLDHRLTSRSPGTWTQDSSFLIERGTFVAGYSTIQSSKNSRYYHAIGTGQMRFDVGDASALFADEASFRLVEGNHCCHLYVHSQRSRFSSLQLEHVGYTLWSEL